LLPWAEHWTWWAIGVGSVMETFVVLESFAQRTAVMNEQYGSLGLELDDSWIDFLNQW